MSGISLTATARGRRRRTWSGKFQAVFGEIDHGPRQAIAELAFEDLRLQAARTQAGRVLEQPTLGPQFQAQEARWPRCVEHAAPDIVGVIDQRTGRQPGQRQKEEVVAMHKQVDGVCVLRGDLLQDVAIVVEGQHLLEGGLQISGLIRGLTGGR